MWQALVSGLSIGSVYALIAQGYYVTYVTTGALNFGQGEFLMVGALFGLTCYVTLGLPYALAVAGAVVLVGAMGAGLERVAIRPTLRHALSLSWVLSTVAVSIILKNAAVQIWGPEQMKFPSPFGDTVIQLGPAGIFPQELFIIFGAIGTVLLVQFFLKRAVLGKALTAVAHNRNAAAVMGINVQRMIVLAFVLSSALAGVGGVLISPITFAWAYMGTVPGIKAFAAAIFGGLENPIGILIGGLVVGVLEQFFGIVNSNLKEGITFLFILLILAVRPTGLMGKKEIEKV
ncbi:MAG: branched-chain amino acid ABC transporter permease [Candidatus Rokubacteria bacterium]|nr:branched-chain amino acid ABC transporter permease [Candidatus Rokubacteria bacterium]